MSPQPRSYWQSAVEDAAMQDEHGFVWKAMLETIDVDLAGTRILDAGCNRGGFLRLLSDSFAINEGFGYDPAEGAIQDARRLGGPRPLHFDAAGTVPIGWGDFDVAFSHEVLYLLHDLAAHAAAIFGALRTGGTYYAVMGVHDASPLMVEWHESHADELGMPRLYAIDEVVDTFRSAGFDAAASRLRIGFVPITGPISGAGSANHTNLDVVRQLQYYNDDKLLLRFTRPAAAD